MGRYLDLADAIAKSPDSANCLGEQSNGIEQSLAAGAVIDAPEDINSCFREVDRHGASNAEPIHESDNYATMPKSALVGEPVELADYETSGDTEWHDNTTKAWFTIPAGTPCSLVEDLDAEELDPWARSILRRRMQSAEEQGEQLRLVRLQGSVCLLNRAQVRPTLASITKCLMAQAACRQ